MERFWSWLGLYLGKHWVLVLVVGTVLTVGLGLGATRLEFATGQDNYLNKSDQVYEDNVAYQDLFGGQAMVTLITMDEGHTVAELFTPEGTDQFRTFSRTMADSGQADSVVTPLTALEFNDALVNSPTGDPTQSIAGRILLGATQRDTSPEGQAARNEDATTTLTRLNEVPVDQRRLDDRAYVDLLLYDNAGAIRKPLLPSFPDERHAQIVTRLHGNQSIEEEGPAADATKEAAGSLHFDNATVLTTGAPELLQDLNDYLTGGMLNLGVISIVVMAVILLVFFSVRWRLLPLAIVLAGVAWAFGIAGYLGIPLTVVTIAGLPVMLGIGIDYTIQMHARVEEEVVVDRAEHPIQEASRGLGPALLIVTFDAIFAFAALRFARVPMIREFGLLLAVGVAAICINSIVGTLAVLGIREHKMPTKRKDYRAGPLGRLVVWLGSLPERAALGLAVASLVIFFAGLAVESRLELQTDPVQWVDQDSQSIKDLKSLQGQTGSASELGVFIQSADVFDDETAAFVDDFTREQLEEEPETLLTGTSIVEIVSDLADVPGAPHVTPIGEDVRAAWDVAPEDVKRSTVAADGGSMNLVFRTGPSGLDARAVVVREIQDTIDPPEGMSATPSGLAVVAVGLLDNLEANRALLTYIAIGFVFAFLAVRLRSFTRALLSLVPVLIAVGVASLLAFVLGLKLSPMTAVGGPLVVAACTEFTSLILLRFLEERRRGLSPREAVDVTAERTGRAFIVSAMTAVAGVAVIATSPLPLLQDFGAIVALNVAVALLSALVVLPPLLVWADKRNWVSKGMVPDEVLYRPPEPEPVPA